MPERPEEEQTTTTASKSSFRAIIQHRRAETAETVRRSNRQKLIAENRLRREQQAKTEADSQRGEPKKLEKKYPD
jgi:hypothetical protein